MTNVATITKNENNKFVATFNGHVVAKSGSLEYVTSAIESGTSEKARRYGVTAYVIKDDAIHPLPNATGEAVKGTIRFSINERFEFLGTLTRMVINGNAPSLLITGPGGYGKTFSVTKEVKDAGLTFTTDFPDVEVDVETAASDDGDEIEEAENQGNSADVHIVKGFSTAKGLYRTLYENNGKLIIFDDCDSIFRDSNAVNILKGALDSYEERWISWNAEVRMGDKNPLPKKFLFTGRIIFISNLNQSQMDGAIKSRCLRVDLNMTAPEKIERMYTIVNGGFFMAEAGIPIETQLRAVEFLDECKYDATELSMRTLISVTKIIVNAETTGEGDWKRLALYNVTA